MDCGNDCFGPAGHAEGCPVHCHCYEPDPIDEPCLACNAEAGEPCRVGCLGYALDHDQL